MQGDRDTAVEVRAYADRTWLYDRAFAPGTEAVREQIADALERRAQEVVGAVLAVIGDQQSRRLLASQADYARQGTILVARWIRTGEAATQQEFDRMGQVRRKAASVTGQITRMVRANLAFRDSVQEVLRDEVGRCGGTIEVLLALCAGTDVGFRQNLLQIGQIFDRRSQAFESALAEKEAELQHQALHDPLTGLANRALLFDRLEQACERLRRHPDRGGIGAFFVDLDNFKLVNDRYGHAAGDAVLRETARRLAGSVRPEDTVARLGGDEFVLVCESVPDAAWAADAERRITERLAVPVDLEGVRLTLGASVGTTVGFPPCEVDQLVRAADDAMYHAKRRTKERCAAGAAPTVARAAAQ